MVIIDVGAKYGSMLNILNLIYSKKTI